MDPKDGPSRCLGWWGASALRASSGQQLENTPRKLGHICRTETDRGGALRLQPGLCACRSLTPVRTRKSAASPPPEARVSRAEGTGDRGDRSSPDGDAARSSS
uniref:Uncharacterized protein n=1 Tax=Rangifer tarandus platyrhynchus TaxID=3082113 RepID=A0ACB0EG83_RANTA|nr:unnamed protein product [Rangifer tarandus platyrhynchus]